ncbi:MAG: ATP-binding protein [Aggregatilineales bacterium]
MANNPTEVSKLQAALAEVLARRDVFSDEAYNQIVLALHDKISAVRVSAANGEPARIADEIRLLTVMFVDVHDSTRLAERFEIDDWKAIIGGTHRRLSEVVRAWNGEVGQYLGDGLLCYFGAHHSQGDEAVRAVSSALAAQEEMAEYAQRVRDRYGIDFAVRIALSTGRAVVGLIGGEKQELLAVGTPTNLAARLQNVCQPGSVVIDVQTHRRVRSHFVTQAHPVIQIKGFDEPVEYFTVVGWHGHRPAQLTSSAVAGIKMPFVGRRAELEHLLAACQQALETGRFQVVTIIGDEGIGKSRLLQEALFRAMDLPFTQFTVVGTYEKRHLSYSLFANLLAANCDLRQDTPRHQAEQLIEAYVTQSWPHAQAAQVAEVMGFVAGYGFDNRQHVRALKPGNSGQRQAVYATLIPWFRGLAEQGALLLAVDNLQWLDQESLGFLEYLAQELDDQPGVLVAAARPELEDYYPDYQAGSPAHTRIKLTELAETDTAALTDSVLRHVDRVPDALPALIRERAEGNPLFVEEFLHMLFDSGVFEPQENGRWRVNLFLYSTVANKLPNGLLALLQARLDKLPQTIRQTLQVAAAIGQTFWAGAVAAVTKPEIAQHALESLERRGIIVQRHNSSLAGEREYYFRHTLYREVAYDMLTRPSREAYHRQAAHWLASRAHDWPDYLALLADHYLKGQQRHEALTTYLQAAENRLERGLLDEALKMVDGGLNAAREIPREIALPLVSRLWLIQGIALNALDRYDESSAASQTALMLMDELPSDHMREERAAAAIALASAYLSLGCYEEAEARLTAARDLVPADNLRQQAALLRTFGNLYLAQGRLAEGFSYEQQALLLAEQGQHHRETTQVMATLGSISLERGDFAAALYYAGRTADRNRANGNLYYQVLDLRQLAYIHANLLAYSQALALCDEAAALMARICYDDPIVRAVRGVCLVALGQADEGLRLLREASQQRQQNARTGLLLGLAEAQALLMTGSYAACQALAEALADQTRGRNGVFHARSLLLLGWAQHELNDPRASATLHTALENELAFGGRDVWLCYYALGHASDDQATADHYNWQALQALRAIAASLDAYPDLRESLLRSPIIHELTQTA